ncbi:endo-1,4-beta-xylanase [Gracilibacillus oryzae]|uniref:Beta-xylanase n=1 Tax=Gracilibacillus oryzae TaxID=1672701 RepID=A0A7C8GT19_9BACI|nr:endo-1,4-beta-xylanase [Gracilibacillus oryzae]KAB8131009.1 endo-1,4-beta-xylanase [Gracilibacillus oryzae]
MENTKSNNYPKLYHDYKEHFLIGAAVNPKTIISQHELITRHFNSVTAENEMKFLSFHPSENQYTFDQADQLISFAKQNGLNVRGHTLVWHNQTPEWLFHSQDGSLVDRETLLARMKDHIDTIITRYKGDIYAWDVVNEVISDKVGEFLRPSKWLDIAGEEFIEKAFLYAHEADPEALLFYNDYNESVPEKREKIYKLVKSLKSKDVPIHGIGLQAHWNLETPSLDHIRKAIERYASLNVQLHITELDVSVFNYEDKRTDLKYPTEEMMIRQAERYEQIFYLFKDYSEYITSVTFWGAADDYTWLDNFPVRNRKNWPFLFDIDHNPKQSYWRVLDIARS